MLQKFGIQASIACCLYDALSIYSRKEWIPVAISFPSLNTSLELKKARDNNNFLTKVQQQHEFKQSFNTTRNIRSHIDSCAWKDKGSHYLSIRNFCSDVPNHKREEDVTIAYVTDIEGNLSYWKNYIKMSKVLILNDKNILSLRDNCHLVFGGDICDRGEGDLIILKELLALKRRYPHRVHFILGNRDINKLRFFYELQGEFSKEPLEVYWLKVPDYHDETRTSKVRDMLRFTMGAPHTLQYRVNELTRLGLPNDLAAASESFVDWVKPGGDLAEYIRYGSLALRIGNVLFCHGGINYRNICSMPWKGIVNADISVNDWILELEKFRSAEMDDFYKNSDKITWKEPWAVKGGYDHSSPASRLMQYGMGWMADKSVNPTIIYTNFLDKHSHPRLPHGWVIQKLNEAGINKIITGHQPHGDLPLPLQSHDRALDMQIFVGDTSYSNDVKWFSGEGKLTSFPSNDHDARGAAVSEICLQFQNVDGKSLDESVSVLKIPQYKVSQVMVHGVLSNGRKYEYIMPTSANNQFIGLPTKDGRWVKGKISGDEYLVAKTEKRLVTNYIVRENELASIVDRPAAAGSSSEQPAAE